MSRRRLPATRIPPACQKLATLMLGAGMSPRELHEKTGIELRLVNRIINGEIAPTDSQVEAMTNEIYSYMRKNGRIP